MVTGIQSGLPQQVLDFGNVDRLVAAARPNGPRKRCSLRH